MSTRDFLRRHVLHNLGLKFIALALGSIRQCSPLSAFNVVVTRPPPILTHAQRSRRSARRIPKLPEDPEKGKGQFPFPLSLSAALPTAGAIQYCHPVVDSPAGASRFTPSAIFRTISAHVYECHPCPFIGRPYVKSASECGFAELSTRSWKS